VPIQVPRSWARQPQAIASASNYAGGLVLLTDVSSGLVYDAITGAPLAANIPPTITTGPLGIAVSSRNNGTPNYSVNASSQLSKLNGATEFSICVVGDLYERLPGNQSRPLYLDDGAGFTWSTFLRVLSDRTATLQLSSGGFGPRVSCTFTIPIDATSLVCTWRAPNTFTAFSNGVQLATALVLDEPCSALNGIGTGLVYGTGYEFEICPQTTLIAIASTRWRNAFDISVNPMRLFTPYKMAIPMPSAVQTMPVLSLAQMINISTTGGQPRVTAT